MSMRQPKPPKASPRSIIEDTALVPSSVAKDVLKEAREALKGLSCEHFIQLLTERAEMAYVSNTNFQRQISKKGDAGRKNMEQYMRHWLACALLKHNVPAALKLPPLFTKDIPNLPQLVTI